MNLKHHLLWGTILLTQFSEELLIASLSVSPDFLGARDPSLSYLAPL